MKKVQERQNNEQAARDGSKVLRNDDIRNGRNSERI